MAVDIWRSILSSETCKSFDEAELAVALSHYDLGVIESITPLVKGSVRSPKVGIVSERGKYLLKRREVAHADVERIRFAHELQQFLRTRGFPAPAVLATRSGRRTFLRLEDFVYELFEFVAGHRFNGSEDQAFDAGRTLARFHEAAAGFRTRSLVPRGDYHDSPAVRAAMLRFAEHLIHAEHAALLRRFLTVYNDTGRAANDCGMATFPPAVIHADWHPGNMLFRNGEVVAVIDYDSVRVSRRVIDVANGALQFSMLSGQTLDDWPDHLDLGRARAFVRGYQSQTRFVAGEASSLPHLMCEAMIAESVGAVARTGSMGALPGMPFLAVLERKLNWLTTHCEELVRAFQSV